MNAKDLNSNIGNFATFKGNLMDTIICTVK